MKVIKRMSLRQLQRMFFSIYGERNERLYGSSNLLLHVFEETAVIAESFRKEDHKDIYPAIARFLNWLLGFCNSEGVDLSDAIFAKYHGACPYCGRPMHCTCISAETKPRKWRRQKKNVMMPDSLQAWQDMFKNIYGRVNKVAGREKCWLHLHEELGEVSRAFRLKERVNLRDELADVFAWLVAFCNNSGIGLEFAILRHYPGKCDVCGKKQCQCPIV